MTIPYVRGWIGLAMFVVGVAMFFFEATKSVGYFPLGFGMGMMASGFQVM